MIADRLELEFLFAERRVSERTDLFPVDYRIARALREQVRGRRVAIVDDAIGAGSAVRATFADLVALGGVPVVIGALVLMGSVGSRFGADQDLALTRERTTGRPDAPAPANHRSHVSRESVMHSYSPSQALSARPGRNDTRDLSRASLQEARRSRLRARQVRTCLMRRSWASKMMS